MAIEDIISEEFETRAPNLEVARADPEDFMSEDEMDPMQDPELQQLFDDLPREQAEVLMQLIKEFKMAVAQGFQGEFEDFVKMKMASAQGSPEDLMTEEEMIIPDEELQSMIPMGQQAAHGGRIRRQGGGIMDVVEEEQVETGPTTQQLIMKWLNDRGLPITPENIQRAIMELSQAGQAPSMPRGEMVAPQMEQPRPPTGALAPGVVGEDQSPDVARMLPQAPQAPAEEVVSEEEILPLKKPYTEDMFSDQVESLLTGMKGAPRSIEYLQNVLEEKKYEFKQDNPNVSDDMINEIIRNKQYDIDNRLRQQSAKGVPFTLAHGGRAGYPYGGEVTPDAPGVRSQVSPESFSRLDAIEGNRMAEEAFQKIMYKFNERFPGIDSSEMSIEDMVAMLQQEGVFETEGAGIMDIGAGMDMITPESHTFCAFVLGLPVS